jgi:hypothetical protein
MISRRLFKIKMYKQEGGKDIEYGALWQGNKKMQSHW